MCGGDGGDGGEGIEGGEGGGKCLPPQLNKKIRDTYLPFGLEVEMCEGLSYSMMMQLEVCQEFTSTTTGIRTRLGSPIGNRPSLANSTAWVTFVNL